MSTAPPRWQQITAVAAGGALGTLARAALTDSPVAQQLAGGAGLEPGSPTALIALVMMANVLGTFLLAALSSALLTASGPGARLTGLAAGTGVCGALTTFSGLVLDVLSLPGALAPVLVLAACAIAGVAAAFAGWFTGSLLRPAPDGGTGAEGSGRGMR